MDVGSAQTRREGGLLFWGERGCSLPKYGTYFVRGARAEALQQSAQHHPILQGALQEALGVCDGFLWRLQYPERYQPCHRLLRRIHVQSQLMLLNKALVFRQRAVYCAVPYNRNMAKKEWCLRRRREEAAETSVCGASADAAHGRAGLLPSPRRMCVFPSLTWQAVKRGSVMRRGSGLHAHPSHSRLLWHHAEPTPVQPVVRTLGLDMNSLPFDGFAFRALWSIRHGVAAVTCIHHLYNQVKHRCFN